jgi:hypothetical protein
MPKAVLIGEFGEGKSSLVNSFLALPQSPIVARLGEGLSTTKHAILYRFGNQASVSGMLRSGQSLWTRSITEFVSSRFQPESSDYIQVSLPHPLLLLFELVDCPGLDSTDPSDLAVVSNEANLADILILVVSKPLSANKAVVMDFLREKIIERGKPFGVVLNCGREPNLFWASSEAVEATMKDVKSTLDAAGFPAPVFFYAENLKKMWDWRTEM